MIGGDFNVTLRANDRPNGEGERDPGSSQFREVLDLLSLAEMGPLDRRFTWSGPVLPIEARSLLMLGGVAGRFPFSGSICSHPTPV